MGRHDLCQDGARLRCVCPCGHQTSGGGEAGRAPHPPTAPAPRVTEPDVPLTFVACATCGALTDINAPTCTECHSPRPGA